MKFIKFSALNGINTGDMAISACIEKMVKIKGYEIVSYDILLRKYIGDSPEKKKASRLLSKIKKSVMSLIKNNSFLYYWFQAVFFDIFKWRRLKKTILQSKEADVIIIGGGNLFFNKNGCVFLHSINKLVNKFHDKRKIVILSVGVGPFSLPWKRKLRNIVEKSYFCSVRDERSLNILKSLGVSKKIHLFPDPAFIIDDIFSENKTQEVSGKKNSEAFGVNIMKHKNSGVSEKVAIDNFSKTLVKLAGTLNIKTVFINSAFAEDHIFVKKIAGNVHTLIKNEIINLRNPLTVPEVFYKLDFIICHRMHTAIFAASCRVPFFVYPWQDKIRSMICEYFGSELEKYLIIEDADFSEQEIVSRLKTFPHELFEKKVLLLKQDVFKMFEAFFDFFRES